MLLLQLLGKEIISSQPNNKDILQNQITIKINQWLLSKNFTKKVCVAMLSCQGHRSVQDSGQRWCSAET